MSFFLLSFKCFSFIKTVVTKLSRTSNFISLRVCYFFVSYDVQRKIIFSFFFISLLFLQELNFLTRGVCSIVMVDLLPEKACKQNPCQIPCDVFVKDWRELLIHIHDTLQNLQQTTLSVDV